ncbi:tryptophanyl-tRNA synthetase [Paenalcaligenes hominis]|uniref:Tryptophan--tRNA ligase n=1 Tax=Paenalcaligenes hominis TaxID=643674 RepID=A0ABX0WTS7_9BURK|nr:tryptophan--tRNA ligase [Paenalcaligenes hominis]NJB66168.1 tryptophanyl-tRNA synthetase [Paenalcaligenes hominis]GGE73440.1 tryptophan--tRNA ligase [Paenalcaligenes hominis]
MTQRVLTGITPSGTPHLGNYAGAIRPAVRASTQPDTDAFFFLADYHALVKCEDPSRVARSRLEIAATWIAAGLDPNKVTFYRQSDIPEIPEFCWMLTCVTNKGLMNRAHAYKGAVDQNTAKGVEPDDGINMGLFSYPILMAADILLFSAHLVPVGRDQIQHLEMARDIAHRFNHLYGQGQTLLTPPYELIDDSVATLPGLDGRKMSKSYDNTIPLFEGGEKLLRSAINSIVTDSKLPGEPKQTEGSHLFELYKAFASVEQTAQFEHELHDGLGWGEAKKKLFDLVNEELSPMREIYNDLMANPDRLEDMLLDGAVKARRIATPMIQTLRAAVGLRSPQSMQVAQPKTHKEKAKAVRVASFRGDEGFQFRLFDAADHEVFLSVPFPDPKQAGQLSKKLQAGEYRLESTANYYQLFVDEVLVAELTQEQQDRLKAAL